MLYLFTDFSEERHALEDLDHYNILNHRSFQLLIIFCCILEYHFYLKPY